MGTDRRESTLEVQRVLQEWCDEVHRNAQLARFAAAVTQHDASEVRLHCVDVRAAVVRSRTRPWTGAAGSGRRVR